jgi:hypothetical protein
MPTGVLSGTPIAVPDSQLNTAFSGLVTGTTPNVPVPFIVSVNSHTYLEDLEFKPWKRQAFRATTVTTTRTQADTSNEPGEQSLSTESLWRRTQDSWHLGAAQVFIDRKNSSEFQFRASKGLNPWTQWQLSLLNDTVQSLTSANTNLDLCVCNNHVYVIDGQVLKYSSDLVTWTTVTGTPASAASSICSDGANVYVAYGANGVYSTTEAAASATQYVSSAINAGAVVRYVMGRLMLGTGNTIYNIITSGALPGTPTQLLFTSNYSNFVWTDFTEGLGVIYASGNSGDKAVIYRITLTTDGSTLAAPVIAGQVPYGETINCIQGYIGGTMAIGTNLGFRFAEQADTLGDLTIGPLIFQPGNVTALSPYDRFIWFTWTNYDSGSTGLGRMDPSQFTADLVPAFASDLMASAQGTVTSIIHFKGAPTFGVSAQGVWTRATTYVPSGSLTTGLITYGLADNKLPVFVDLTMQKLAGGSITTAVSLNGASAFVVIGTISTTGATFVEFSTPQQLSETIEIQETLNAGNSNTVTPVLTRHTLRSVPAPAVPTDLFVVIQLRERFKVNDIELQIVPSQEYLYLDGLRATKQVNTVQIGNLGPFQATLESIDWIPEQLAGLSGELNGVAVCNFRTVV